MDDIKTKSPLETFEFGVELASRLRPGDVVALAGELGAGKTLLTKGICRGLGFGGEVTSPSFVRLHRYVAPVAQTFLSERKSTDRNVCPTVQHIHHADFYLLRDRDEVMGLGLDELYGGDGIVIVEWAQRFPELIPKGSWWITIEWGEQEFERSWKVGKLESYERISE